jgi:hypothetical protein
VFVVKVNLTSGGNFFAKSAEALFSENNFNPLVYNIALLSVCFFEF